MVGRVVGGRAACALPTVCDRSRAAARRTPAGWPDPPPALPVCMSEVASVGQWREAQLEEWGRKEAARCDSGDPGGCCTLRLRCAQGRVVRKVVLPAGALLRCLLPMKPLWVAAACLL